jgi:hypothetical protein
MDTIVFSRQQFYELVWSDSLLALSKKYNMSDNGLRKACVRMEIPLPDAGYWNKVKAGIKVAKKSLPTGYKGEQSIRLSLRESDDVRSNEGLSYQSQLQWQIELDPNIDLKVKTILYVPDQLVANAHKDFKKYKYKPGELLSTGIGNLDIRVSPDFVNRALCFMDAFIKIMRQRGHNFKIDNNATYLLIAGEEMKMTLSEVQSKELEDGRFERTGFHTKGLLSFRFDRFGTTASSTDGKILIEEQLSKLIAKLELLGERFKKERAEQKRQRDEFEEEQRIRKELMERKRIEMGKVRQLFEDSRRSEKAEEIRRYIDRLEQKMMFDDNAISEEMELWLEWARQKANWIDPIVDGQDEWLDDNDRYSLFKENKPHENSFIGYNDSSLPTQKEWWPGQKWYSRK